MSHPSQLARVVFVVPGTQGRMIIIMSEFLSETSQQHYLPLAILQVQSHSGFTIAIVRAVKFLEE